MSMTNPTILELLEKADCRYTLACEISKRARDLVDEAQPLVETKGRETMPLSIAIDEVNRGLITYSRPTDSNV